MSDEQFVQQTEDTEFSYLTGYFFINRLPIANALGWLVKWVVFGAKCKKEQTALNHNAGIAFYLNCTKKYSWTF